MILSESELIAKEPSPLLPTVAEWEGRCHTDARYVARMLLPALALLALLYFVRSWPYWPLLFVLLLCSGSEKRVRFWWMRFWTKRPPGNLDELAAAPAPTQTYAVRAVFVRASMPYGEDQGMLTIADGYCHFEGYACWFSIARVDTLPFFKVNREMLERDREPILSYRNNGVDAEVRFEPLTERPLYRAEESRLRNALRTFLVSDQPGAVSRFPPKKIQPGGQFMILSHWLQRIVGFCWMMALIWDVFHPEELAFEVAILVRVIVGMMTLMVSLFVVAGTVAYAVGRWKMRFPDRSL